MIHLKKLSVGTESVETLVEWQETQTVLYHGQEVVRRTTRNKPKQEKALLAGGSIYWIINRRIQCRQNIVGIEQEIDEEGRPYCVLMLDQEMIRTQVTSHKPFQGWRYLEPHKAPKDIGEYMGEDDSDIDPQMESELRELGLL